MLLLLASLLNAYEYVEVIEHQVLIKLIYNLQFTFNFKCLPLLGSLLLSSLYLSRALFKNIYDWPATLDFQKLQNPCIYCIPKLKLATKIVSTSSALIKIWTNPKGVPIQDQQPFISHQCFIHNRRISSLLKRYQR